MDRGVGLILGLRTYRVFGNHTSQQGSIDYRWYGGRGGGGNGCDHKHEAKKKGMRTNQQKKNPFLGALGHTGRSICDY